MNFRKNTVRSSDRTYEIALCYFEVIIVGKKYSYFIMMMDYACLSMYIYVISQLVIVFLLRPINENLVIIYYIMILLIPCILAIVKVYKKKLLKKHGAIMEAYVSKESLYDISSPITYSPHKSVRINLRGRIKTPYGYMPFEGKVKLGVLQSFLYSEIMNIENNIKIPTMKVLMDTKYYKIYHIYAYEFLKELYEVNCGGYKNYFK